MSLVIDALNSSTVSEELSNIEVGIINGIFDVQDYASGKKIVRPNDKQSKNICIFALFSGLVASSASIVVWACLS
jgi:hypothetical protein